MSSEPAWRPGVVGAVLMGGASRRFGSDKALADVGGRPMAASVVGAMRGAGIDPVVAVGGSAGAELGVPTIPDRRPGDGPLAALATVLAWSSTDWVLVAPCDHPLLTSAHLIPLLDARLDPAGATAVVATLDGVPQPQLACWPSAAARTLQRRVDAGARAFRTALDVVAWSGVAMSDAALSDADDPVTLAALLERNPDSRP